MRTPARAFARSIPTPAHSRLGTPGHSQGSPSEAALPPHLLASRRCTSTTTLSSAAILLRAGTISAPPSSVGRHQPPHLLRVSSSNASSASPPLGSPSTSPSLLGCCCCAGSLSPALGPPPRPPSHPDRHRRLPGWVRASSAHARPPPGRISHGRFLAPPHISSAPVTSRHSVQSGCRQLHVAAFRHYRIAPFADASDAAVPRQLADARPRQEEQPRVGMQGARHRQTQQSTDSASKHTVRPSLRRIWPSDMALPPEQKLEGEEEGAWVRGRSKVALPPPSSLLARLRTGQLWRRRRQGGRGMRAGGGGWGGCPSHPERTMRGRDLDA
uniref:Uncharacterized protein n=1 Tax=Setaria italica TaxID=4555 RepID=K3YCT5_SETIT